MPDTIILIVSMPPKRVHPNVRPTMSRGAMHARRVAVRKYRALVAAVAMEAQGADRPFNWERASALLIYHFTTRRRRDRDNHLGWFKSGFDGLRDSGLITDDSGLVHQPVEFRIGGDVEYLEVEITKLP